MLNSIRLRIVLVAALALSAALVWAALGLQGPVTVVYDEHRIPTIRASNELDAIYTLGYLHAKDRFFQMDVQRRLFSGTLAELVGPSALEQDVLLRTLGLRRAAERSLDVQTPEVIAWLEAYSDGVNAFLQNEVIGTGDDESCTAADERFDDEFDDEIQDTIVNSLPPEYAVLATGLDGIAPWTPLDSLTMVKGLAFGLSFDLDDIDRTLAILTFRGVEPLINALGQPFNGLQMFNVDLYPAAPFDPAISIPSAAVLSTGDEEVQAVAGEGGLADMSRGSAADAVAPGDGEEEDPLPDYLLNPSLPSLLQNYRDAAAESPLLLRALERDYTQQGSNWFLASGALTDSGSPMIANDPHLALGTPSTFYEAHIQVENGINVTGATFPGAPGVVIGCNDVICWGATVNPLDVTDVFQEVLIGLGPGGPAVPTHIFRADGLPEALDVVLQTYLFNVPDGVGNPTGILADAHLAGILPPETAATLIVPRRNNGPIVQVIFPEPTDPPGTPINGLSVAYTGWSPTRELEAFRLFARAETPQEFADALQFFDVGSQNWGYADINGNIAYYTSAELPIREDLQNFPFFPAALQPPYLIRDGTHTLAHDWMPLTGSPQPQQALDYPLPSGGDCCEILPFAEMPQVVNPPEGYILQANNDPIGTSLDNTSWDEFRAGFNGRLYLSPGYATGFRMGRLQRLFDDALSGGGTLSLQQFKDFQANNQLLDAEILLPYLFEAFDNASTSSTPALSALAADGRMQEAIARLAAWDFSTPTGIAEGFDPGDPPMLPGMPSAPPEVDSSIPAGGFGSPIGLSQGFAPSDEAPLPGNPPSQDEIDASVAATIYSVWRGQFVQRVIDGTLIRLRDLTGLVLPEPVPMEDFAPGSSQSIVAVKQLLEDYPVTGGAGASLINFFQEPGFGAGFFDPRDLSLLRSLEAALDLLASPEFAPAFGGSVVQDDYRWGKLHRLVLEHPLGGPFNIPPTGGPGNLAPDLPGFARAGGLGAVDASAHDARADSLNAFMFDSGPARRFVATMRPSGPDALEVLPGGESGIPGSPYQTDQLNLWLVNQFHALPLTSTDVFYNAESCQTLVPPPMSSVVPSTGLESVVAPTDGRHQSLSEREDGSRRAGSDARPSKRPRKPQR